MSESMPSGSISARHRALLLDVDGALVDSTYLHVSTWHRALNKAGATVPHVEVRELVRGAHHRGWITVLATSAPPSEFRGARELLNVDDVVDAVTTGEDVDRAKPDPTIVGIALDRAGVDAAEAIMVGDATWDAIAATKLNIRSIAVRTGGIGDDELRAAGFSDIVDNAAAVLDLLD